MNKNKTNKQAVFAPFERPHESLKVRCARLRREAELCNDDSSAIFYTALYQAVSLRIPESIKESALILLLNRKLAD